MTKEIWINLPVKDVNKSKDFFTKLGFHLNAQHGNTDHSACFLIGQNKTVMMLFDETTFKSFTNASISNADQSAELLLSIDAESKDEVDDMARKAVEAGGKSSHQPGEMKGWMYGCLFSDVDGHRWNVLYMDKSKMPVSK
jgi:predicted lactoylglutathione lyase